MSRAALVRSPITYNNNQQGLSDASSESEHSGGSARDCDKFKNVQTQANDNGCTVETSDDGSVERKKWPLHLKASSKNNIYRDNGFECSFQSKSNPFRNEDMAQNSLSSASFFELHSSGPSKPNNSVLISDINNNTHIPASAEAPPGTSTILKKEIEEADFGTANKTKSITNAENYREDRDEVDKQSDRGNLFKNDVSVRNVIRRMNDAVTSDIFQNGTCSSFGDEGSSVLQRIYSIDYDGDLEDDEI